MADIVKGLKNAWLKGMEAIGDTASNIANNTKYKVQEMNLINRRHEILSDFGTRAYALWQQGEQFPPELQQQLDELSKVDETLNTLRAERLAYLQTMEEERAARAAAAAAESGDFVPDEPTSDPAETEEPAEETAEPAPDTAEAEEAHAAPVMDFPADDADESTDAVEEPAEAAVPVLEIPDEEPEATVDVPFEDVIDKLFKEDAPKAPEVPEAPAAGKEKSQQRLEFEKKVNKAIDTVQEKVSQFGRVIDRSVQNLAKVVLQNEDKDKQNKQPEDIDPDL